MSFFPLTDKWIPNELLVRDQQLNVLLENQKKEFSANYWICGDKGLGKTLTAKLFTCIVDGSLILNCTSQSFKDSVKTFALTHGIVPKTTESAVTTIMQIINKTQCKKPILFIDDVDKLKEYFKRDFTVYLHDLYDRMLDSYDAFSIHIITTLPFNQMEKHLSPPAVSRLRFKPLTFPRYSKDEILALLKQRLDYINSVQIQEDALKLIGDKISRIGGDFRKALEITRNALIDNKLTTETVENAWKTEKETFWKNQMLELPYHEALILACIIQETLTLKDNVTKPPYLPVSWKQVKNSYIKHCQMLAIPPHREKMQYYWLEQLWLQRWIDKFTLSTKHEWNYTHERGLFIRLLEKLENLVEPIKAIDWTKTW